MEWQLVVLLVAVALASGLQAATGIGFGVIAGPVLLLVLDDHSAIQVSIALSLLIGVVLIPSVWRNIRRGLLAFLLAGTVLGLPLGLGLFLVADIHWLKFLAGLAVLWTGLFARRSMRQDADGSKFSDEPMGQAGRNRPGSAAMVGCVSGIMSGSLAMPGPVVAAWMSAEKYPKEAIRATILAMFLFSYVAAFVLQAVGRGVAEATLHQIAVLALPTLLGVAGGARLAKSLSERVFQRILLTVLAVTALGLFVSSIPFLFGW